MKIKQHDLDGSKASGNGHHGNCYHCGSPFVTGLGYCSWDETECIEREVFRESDVPDEVRSYANFRGMQYNPHKSVENKIAIYTRPYDKDFTIDEILELINTLK